MAPPHNATRWGPIRSLLYLSPFFFVIPWLALHELYDLPEPITDLVNPDTGLPQISETQILAHVRHLSEDIGFRTVGTAEHALADKWMIDTAHEVQRECQRIVQADPERKLECEVWHQRGSGAHRFDMMGKRLYKTYTDLTNIVIRVSNGTSEGKEHAVLVNAHLDSTLPSPGAADDALSVGVMLECIRVLTHTPGWTPAYAIVFLFNHGEESLQDASHLFSTQHPVAHTIRAFINLEAAGNKGAELLFQVNSEEMIRAYSKVPRPFGTVIASEIFSSGVLLSDTDFRQFEQYLNVTGLDVAVVGNSYVYHTRQDIVDNIQPGVAQRMAENALAMLQYLSSDASPLPSLTTGYSRPATVFFTQFGRFFQFQFATARLMYGTLFALSLTLARFAYQKRAPGSSSTGFLTEQWKGARALLFALCGALIGANGLAAMMHRALGRNMSWFASEHSALLLYGPATFGGILASQVVFPEVAERSVLTALLLMQSGGALLLQLLGLGSSYLLFFGALPLFVALSLDTLLNHGPVVSLWTYALSLVVPLLTGMQMTCVVLDVFVPLTGRIGADAQAEHVIASIAAVMLSITVPLVTPFSHRFSENVRMNAVTVLNIVTVGAVAIFALRSPFDDTHQRRVFLLGSDNITSQERYLHVSAADGAPGFEQLVHDIAANFGVVGTQAVQEDMHDWNGDWDILYPFSAFVSAYKLPLPIEPGFVSPFAAGERAFKVEAINDTLDLVAGTRSLTLQITHPGLIWTVLAFDAHVLQWTLDDAPPNEFTRHHIKGASFYGIDRWSVDLVLEGTSPLMINFLAIDEAAMWPGKKAATEAQGGHAMMTLFESVDNWLARETRDSVDVMLLATVGGVVTV
ncbi:hypothetical protein EDB92DRAFT_1986255 [Lactarius akahatsu]|uniref:Peptide hydrolase n=1 Tax=Lactarius akahatsu TaxID=416441 RepID=A0AAD4LMZ7_9AGAM|nr:hypothetical protein EDB92DRAFT_1986255 [Lactarius akahatsu]